MQENTYSIDNLSSGALTHIASFLAVPSRALFALALSVTSEESMTIVGTQCDILDFGEIHKDLAAKLTDDHISDVLLSVNAANRVKRLRLTGCVNITGAGLEPLRGSLVIEQIDLCLGWGPEIAGAELPISCNHVLPILDSIIEQETCALKHLHFPYAWRWNRTIDSEFDHFVMRYNQMWARRQEALSCMKCSADLPQSRPDGRGPWVQNVVGPWMHNMAGYWSGYGTQLHTCYGCLKHYCRNCESDISRGKLLDTCTECNRVYCADCSPVIACAGLECHTRLCSGCTSDERTCRNCGNTCCDGCFIPCDSCGFFCDNCSEDHFATDTCEDCNETLCFGCRNQSQNKEINFCSGSCSRRRCYGCLVNRFLEDGTSVECCFGNLDLGGVSYVLKERFEVLTNKIVELTNMNEELTSENKQLRSKIKSLRKFEGNSDQEGHVDH